MGSKVNEIKVAPSQQTAIILGKGVPQLKFSHGISVEKAIILSNGFFYIGKLEPFPAAQTSEKCKDLTKVKGSRVKCLLVCKNAVVNRKISKSCIFEHPGNATQLFLIVNLPPIETGSKREI
ncbi:hypothetical protein AVEN_230677-1 [Araneus ventricosus]|uniref:Uncharacterized protein n=1 Tax=Araneus ventricosus TaxID=182803 RepID=A0A4Y2A1X6_ARAVE|nr:hypothetical protein AVEN_230677-1 [Araneus ventricosus]